RTTGRDCERPFAEIDHVPDGAMSPDGKVIGTYLHGFLAADAFRARFLESLGVRSGEVDYRGSVESALDEIADELERHLDCDAIFSLAREKGARILAPQSGKLALGSAEQARCGKDNIGDGHHPEGRDSTQAEDAKCHQQPDDGDHNGDDEDNL